MDTHFIFKARVLMSDNLRIFLLVKNINDSGQVNLY